MKSETPKIAFKNVVFPIYSDPITEMTIQVLSSFPPISKFSLNYNNDFLSSEE
jgi:hypothetical protein